MKEHKETPVLEILVQIDSDRIVELEGETGHVTMIPFRGSVSSGIFTGIVEPCGVDTQVTDPNGVRHMSARYMLTGKDQDGTDCHIYIENNGYFTGDEFPWPFHTVPTFMTDSVRLAPYLHRNQFIGEGQRDERGLWIRFYELENKAE